MRRRRVGKRSQSTSPQSPGWVLHTPHTAHLAAAAAAAPPSGPPSPPQPEPLLQLPDRSATVSATVGGVAALPVLSRSRKYLNLLGKLGEPWGTRTPDPVIKSIILACRGFRALAVNCTIPPTGTRAWMVFFLLQTSPPKCPVFELSATVTATVEPWKNIAFIALPTGYRQHALPARPCNCLRYTRP